MKSKKLLILVLIIPFFAFTAHKYYLSLTQIEYNTTTKSVEVIINVFVDDIQTALDKLHDKKFKLDTKDELKDSDTYFYEYLKNHVKFKIDNKPVSYTYIAKEYEDDVVFFYLEIKNINSIEEIEINNTLLIKEFPEQQNLIKSKVNKKHKSVLLTNKEQKGILKH